jgi:serine/threonine-protein kinase
VTRSTLAKEIFSDAAIRDAASRAQFLDRACAGDAKLRAEVESLLATQNRMGDFLNMPTLEVEREGKGDAEAAANQSPRAKQ